VGYVLELHGGYYYVGKTAQELKVRLEQHRKGEQGSKWTRRHRYKQCVLQRQVPASQASGWETNTTAEWMLNKGVNKVRGPGSPVTGTMARKTRTCLCAPLVMRWS
jgi:predicted GIY-YIG superfamily endonuclease